MIADYASTDNSGKLNAIGGGLSVIAPRSPQEGLAGVPLGLTSPFSLVVGASVPPTFYGTEVALEVVLEDLSGSPVQLPGPAGQLQVMRIGQNIAFGPRFPG
jgi:hypothetical protein